MAKKSRFGEENGEVNRSLAKKMAKSSLFGEIESLFGEMKSRFGEKNGEEIAL